jgi:uroporphyrinogen-III decarboxylase
VREEHWDTLLKLINGEVVDPPPVGFIIDSPWLPAWFGVDILDYYSSDELWLQANLRAHETFPEVIFLPGFWSEYGMCTEPSAFGSKAIFQRNQFPHAEKVIRNSEDIQELKVPDPRTDGLLPFVLNRLRLSRDAVRRAGYSYRFAVARGPLNIAAFLMGTTEFLTAMMLEPENAHLLLEKITTFLEDWLDLQLNEFDDMNGILLLDDILGFIGEKEFTDFGLPYLKRLYSREVAVKFLHNDASCELSARHLPEIGINMFNMAFDTDLNHLKTQTDSRVVMVGNIPPRDVLAAGTPDDVKQAALAQMSRLQDPSMVLFSCGGGMPPGVPTENLTAFTQTVRTSRRQG